jgi:hypothetical protein
MKKMGFIAGAVLIVVLLLPALVLGQATIWDGTQWKNLPQEVKVGYVKGVGNLADYEMAASRTRTGVVARALHDEWRNKSIGMIVQEVDRYYRENPQKMSLPVIEVMLRCCPGLHIP